MAQLRLRLQRPWIPYIIFLVTLLLTCASTYYVGKSAKERDRLRFFTAVQRTENSINTQLEVYTALLRGSSGLFAEDNNVTQSEFKAYVDRLLLPMHYTGVQGIGYIMLIPEDEKNTMLSSINNENGTNVTIKPSGERDEYSIVTYLEPESKTNNAVPGFDIESNTTLKDALQQARDTGLPTASGKITLQKTTTQPQQPGFMIFVPIYSGGSVPDTVAGRRDNLLGYVYSPFRAQSLLNKVIDPRDNSEITFEIYDGSKVTKSNLLYTSPAATSIPKQYAPLFRTTRAEKIVGRTWTIAFATQPTFENVSEQNLPPIIFIGGLLVSLMFFMLSRSEYTAKRKAETTATQLQQYQKELQNAIGMRDNFISIASHELKTPVTSMKVYGEVLLKRFSEKGDKNAVDYLTKLHKQINKLTLLIQDLLDVSRLEAGHLALNIEKFNVNEMIKDVVDSNQPIASNHKILIRGKATRQVWGDKDRINQVVSNLITNAVKYSPKADKVVISVTNLSRGVAIAVQDFGIGISKENQKKVFSRFYRVNGTKGKTFPGLGIGLYICHEIINRHGSKITISSKLNEGSIFTFILPTQKKLVSLNRSYQTIT